MDACDLLIPATSLIKESQVKSVNIEKKVIYPDEAYSFEFNDIKYKLWATGVKRKLSEESYEVYNYKLYLTAELDGDVETESLLVSKPAFDAAMINLLWIGDLDGDGKIDLLIDTSNHYNATILTLYLSSEADAGEVVRVVGFHKSVGC
jgi:hypothetical protein